MTTHILGLAGDVEDHFTSNLASDFLDVLAPKVLGRGIGREVRVLGTNEDYVVKMQIRVGGFQNVHEWQVWEQVEYWNWGRKWVAPCSMISPCGLVLIQRRTSPIPHDFKMPDKVPTWFMDMKRSNWGLLDGKLVCHDYGLTRTMSKGLSKKMRKADWIDD